MRDFFESTGGVILCAGVALVLFIGGIILAAGTLKKNEVTQMKACVASGQQWKYNRDGNTHECVK